MEVGARAQLSPKLLAKAAIILTSLSAGRHSWQAGRKAGMVRCH